MKQSGKKHIKKMLEEKKKKSESLYKEMEIGNENSNTITIESLYSQLQSLKHEIDIEVIQKKLMKYDRVLKLLADNNDTLLEMIDWYKKNSRKNK